MKKNSFARGEFMEFMDSFLSAHPEVIEDQKRGWDIYWSPKKGCRDEPSGEAVDVVVAN